MATYEVKRFPTLYKKTSTGAIQQWDTFVVMVVDVPTIFTEYGQIDGKIQQSTEEVFEGKNIGKANETTALEQAVSQAESDWKKQLKKGYVDNIEDAKAGKTDKIIEGGIFPMLAHKFSEQGHKIKYPALCQPKLDGSRCVSERYGETITLWSRTRKPINSVPHICKALCEVMLLNDITYLDGEMYNHEYHDKFEDLISLIRQEKPIEGCEVVQYHVYDFPHPTLTNGERNEVLQSLLPVFENTPIHIVETIVVNDEDELMDAFDHFIALGYEGCMVRNMDGLYVNKRSYDLQKVKEFSDSEYKVVDVKVGTKGSMAGKAIFICETEEGVQFAAKMVGKMDDLIKYANNPELAIGRMMTVKYQGLTNKNNVPRFPVAMRFRIDI
jgi:ATP-dependent DNA ligase